MNTITENLIHKKQQYINALPLNFIDIKKNYFLTAFTVDCDPSLK